LIKKVELDHSVIIHTDKDYRQACRAAFDFLQVAERAKGRDKIVIKPNLISCRPYAAGSVTDPLVLDALLEQLRKTYDGEIVIAEAENISKTRSRLERRGMGKTVEEFREGFQLALQNSGISSVLEKRGDPDICVLDVSDTEYEDPEIVIRVVRKRYGGLADKIHPEYLGMVPKCLLHGNILGINLTKFKTHDNRPTVVTLALKNLFGFTTPPNREHLHGSWHNPWRLVESIISMNLIYLSVFQTWLHVVDGLRYCMEGNGPNMGTTVENWGKVAAGTNPVELDAICAHMMGQKPRGLPYLIEASKYLGGYDERVVSRIPPEFVRKFALNDKVIAWLEAERAHSPYILYLTLTGYIWNKTPKLARLLSPLAQAVRRAFARFWAERKP
jgi:uncharacterized protein (DUF362 family)